MIDEKVERLFESYKAIDEATYAKDADKQTEIEKKKNQIKKYFPEEFDDDESDD